MAGFEIMLESSLWADTNPASSDADTDVSADCAMTECASEKADANMPTGDAAMIPDVVGSSCEGIGVSVL